MTYLAVFLTVPVAFALLAFIAFRWLKPIYLSENFLGKYAVAPLLAAIWLIDVAFNATYGALIFWQLPFAKDYQRGRITLTFSDRLQHIVTSFEHRSTWRKALALPLARFTNWVTEPNHIMGV